MKQVIFPLREEKSWLVKYFLDDVMYGMYVTAVDEASAKWKVTQNEPEAEPISAEPGTPLDRDWD